jgi:hypothetical protein
VSLSGDATTVAIGAERNSGVNGTSSGHVRVHRYDAGLDQWTQLGDDIDGEAVGDLSVIRLCENQALKYLFDCVSIVGA